MDIRSIVKNAMDAKGWTCYRLAIKAGMRPSQLLRWLNQGRASSYQSIRSDRLETVLDALGLSITEQPQAAEEDQPQN